MGEVGIPTASGVVEFALLLPAGEVGFDGGVLVGEGFGLDGAADGVEIDVLAGGGEEFGDEFFGEVVLAIEVGKGGFFVALDGDLDGTFGTFEEGFGVFFSGYRLFECVGNL